ncbi:hypothetical protein NDU88_004457 [Pleurodeles waltl]|uniref:Uncharacterized protein n=1 Tax=Pleurodeles waltl TaxID=8319 RepID=A0AAV7L8V1_PLEWA|nr:hypothetical protein NDU88_004457 [Pleurodeles waltl]
MPPQAAPAIGPLPRESAEGGRGWGTLSSSARCHGAGGTGGSSVDSQAMARVAMGRALPVDPVIRDTEAGRLTGAGELCAALCSTSVLRRADLNPEPEMPLVSSVSLTQAKAERQN